MLNSIKHMDNNLTKIGTATEPIFATTDYRMFKLVKGNRLINRRHVARLVASIERKNMLPQNPILVNNKMEIIDGQHRLQAAKGLRVPIYYTIIDAAGLAEVQQLNSYTQIWKSSDYLQSYTTVGQQKYIDFKKFLDEYQFSIEAGFNLIYGDSRGEIYHSFRSGTLDYTPEQLENARNKADLVFDVRKFITTKSRATFFYRAIHMIYDKGLGEELRKKLLESGSILKPQYTLKDWLRTFEDVINYKKSKDIKRLY